MSTLDLETTVTIQATLPRDGTGPSRLTANTQPSPGEIDGESLPNVAKRLDNFSILRKLGSGAMGVVYAAYDDHLGRRVAIKLLRPHLGTHSPRFVREAQGLARLSHPNVVQVYQVGTYDNRLFIAMEFVDGQTLRSWLQKGPHTRDEVLRVFKDAGRGLAAAHEANLVHRDFKPDNVMVGDDGRVCVMDFGLVHEDGGDLEELLSSDGSSREDREVAHRRLDSALNLELTQPGALLGTPAYMAPEQHLGQPTDARADQFSYCVTLWEALYGKRPFVGDSWQELIENVSSHNIVEPKRGADVPNWLRAVVERGLATDPEERWDSMDEMLEALEQDPTRRRRVLVASGVALSLSIASVAGFQVYEQREREAKAAALQAAEQALDLRCSAEGRDEIAKVWSARARAAVGSAMKSHDHPIAEEAWTRTEALIDGYAGAWAEVRKQSCIEVEHEPEREDWARLVRNCLDERARDLGSRVKVLSKFDDPGGVIRAVNLIGGLPSVDDCTDADLLSRNISVPDAEIIDEVDAARGIISDASANFEMGRLAIAHRSASAALQEAKRIGWAPLEADALYWRGRSAMAMGPSKEGEKDLESAVFLAGKGRDRIAIDAAGALAYNLRWNEPEAALRWGRVGELLIAHSEAEGSLAHAKLLSDIGTARTQMKNFEGAIESFDHALEIYSQRLPEGHPDQAKLLNNLAVAHTDLERYPEALELHQRVLELRTRNLPHDHPDFGITHFGLGRVFLAQNKLALATEAFERALEIFELSADEHKASIGFTLTKLGAVLGSDGKLREAEAKLERALDLQEQLGMPPFVLAETRFELAKVIWPLGELERALELAEVARAAYAEAEGEQAKLAGVEQWQARHAAPPGSTRSDVEN